MTQTHARRYFARVALIDARRNAMLAAYRAKWINGRGIESVYNSPRYVRLCRAASLYRVAGYLGASNAQLD